MGLDPIRYKPWNGQRTEHARRFWVISDNVLKQKLRSKWLIGLIILGMVLVFVFPIILLSMAPHDSLTAEMMLEVLQNDVLIIFVIIIVSIVCADLISEDLRGNSLVLYLYRALRPERYLLGKTLGALLVIAIFTLIPSLVLAVAATATQSGPDYAASAEVIGRTLIAGLLTTVFFVPIGIMISSFTTKRTYAAVGIFMFFFTLTIVSGIFADTNINWNLLGPGNVLYYAYDVIYGIDLPEGLSSIGLALILVIIMVPPSFITYYRIVRKGVGK
jgi:ABC-type transport system involved in multi-copper enzyme maturation permease subunit